MGERKFLTPRQLSERFCFRITEKTLANWRNANMGPPYTKIGGRILYPIDEVTAWERTRLTQTRHQDA